MFRLKIIAISLHNWGILVVCRVWSARHIYFLTEIKLLHVMHFLLKGHLNDARDKPEGIVKS